MESLVRPEYIGAEQGSSLAELMLAAEDNGLYAIPLGEMNTEYLRSARYPMILNTRADSNSTHFDHYVLFLASDGSKALIYDAPHTPDWVSFADLSQMWNGRGLVVSDNLLDDSMVVGQRTKWRIREAVVLALFVLGTVVIYRVHAARR